MSGILLDPEDLEMKIYGSLTWKVLQSSEGGKVTNNYNSLYWYHNKGACNVTKSTEDGSNICLTM